MTLNIPSATTSARLATLLCMLVSLLVLAPLRAADEQAFEPFERWYVVEMTGERVGYAHMTQAQENGEIISSQRMQITLKRGATAMRIRVASSFHETPDGTPLRATANMDLGAMRISQSLTFADDGSRLFISSQAGREQRETLDPIEGHWLPPAAMNRHVQQQMRQGVERITVRTLELSASNEPMDLTLSVLGEEQVQVFGRVAPAIVWESRVAQFPNIVSREYVDANGHILKSTAEIMPGMTYTLLAADRDLALSPVDPPEIVAGLLVQLDAPMHHARHQRQLTYDIRVRGEVSLDERALPSTGYQHVTWLDDRHARVRVDLDATPADDTSFEPVHLAASTMIDRNDPKIIQLVEQALGENHRTMTDVQKAHALRAFVYAYVEAKDLSVGMGSASETARTRQGDCTEHAVLLAAMLRVAGIPSRVATGLMYVDEFIGQRHVLGGHMWTQAWLADADDQGAPSRGRWIDLDPSLPEAAFDAAHITLGVSALEQAHMSNEMVMMARLLGSLDIQVIDNPPVPGDGR